MVVAQGDVFWVDFGPASGSAPAYLRPCVIVQHAYYNRRLSTVVVCILTSNLQRAAARGNVLLDPGEAHLPKQSAVNVSQLVTVDKKDLREKIGTLSHERVRQILVGIQLVLAPPSAASSVAE